MSLKVQAHRPTLGEAGTFIHSSLRWPSRELSRRSYPAELFPPLACDVGCITALGSPTHLVDNEGRRLLGLTTSTTLVPVLRPYRSCPSQDQSASQWGACISRPGSGQLGYVGSLHPKGLLLNTLTTNLHKHSYERIAFCNCTCIHSSIAIDTHPNRTEVSIQSPLNQHMYPILALRSTHTHIEHSHSVHVCAKIHNSVTC